MMKNIYSILLIFLASINANATVDSTATQAKKLAIDSAIQDSVEIKKPSIFSKSGLLNEIVDGETGVETVSVVKDIFNGGKIFWAVLIILFTFLLLRIVKKMLEVFAERSAQFRITLKSIIPIATVIGWLLASYIIIAAVFQPPYETIFAALTSVGIALGFASQDILKNIFAGIVILVDRPFKVGDKIEIGDYYGEVIQIGMRSTKLVTPDDSMVSVPNTEIMNFSVSNSNSGEPNCQVVAEFWLPPDIDTRRVRQLATEAAQVSRFIYLNKPIVVLFFNEVKEKRPFLKMRLKAYVMDIRSEFAFKSDMTELVMEQLYREKILSDNYFNGGFN